MNKEEIREHWYWIVSAVFSAEHNAITDNDRHALKDGTLSPDDYVYKVVDEIIKKQATNHEKKLPEKENT